MKRLNHSKLQSLSKNTNVNKTTNAEDSLDIMIALLDYQDNFEELVRTNNNYSATNVLLSDNNWMRRKNVDTYRDPIGEGNIFITDFGKAYKGECAYIHFSLCVRVYRDKVFVIPTTSNVNMFAKAFHPADNRSGNYWLRRGNKTEGFSKNCTLLLNDAKFISLGRIIKALPPINADALESIKKHLFSVNFPNYEKEFVNRANEIENLREDKEKLEGHNKSLQAKLEALEKELTNKGV